MSQNDQSQKVVLRFYEALDRLKADGVIRGVSAFARIYGVNAWNFATQRSHGATRYRCHGLATWSATSGSHPRGFCSGKGVFTHRPGLLKS